MKTTSTTLTWITYAVLLGAVSVLLNDIREFNFQGFEDFQNWAKTANPNTPWYAREEILKWNFYAISVGLFFIKGYLIYGFSYLISILNEVDKGRYFTEKVIGYFKKIGSVIINYVIWLVILKSLENFLDDSSFKFINEFKSELTYLIPCALGFYLLADIFKRAKALQDENDLTV